MTKVTKAKLLEKVLETQYDKGKIETIEKILEGSKEGDGLDRATTIIDNINALLEDFVKKYKPLIDKKFNDSKM